MSDLRCSQCNGADISRTDRCNGCGWMLGDKADMSSKAQDNRANDALKLDKYSKRRNMERTIELPSGGFVGKCQHCGGRCENRTLDACSTCFRTATCAVLAPEEIERPWTAAEAKRAGAAYVKEWVGAHGSLARQAVDEKWKAIYLKNDPEGKHAKPADAEFDRVAEMWAKVIA